MSQKETNSTSQPSLERISQLISDLEQELMAIPTDSTRLQVLKDEVALIKRTIAATDRETETLQQQLRGTHDKLGDLIANVEGELLKDTHYLTELGRILGLI